MIIKAFCARMDHGGCGLLLHVEKGKIVKIEGDPESPLNRGTVCAKGIAQLERLNHPERLRYPLKRAGAKGDGKWQRISWEEALSTIAQKIRERVEQGKERSIAFAQGTPKGLELYMMIRLANVLQVPNVATPGSICHMPRETGALITCGFFPVPDYDYPPALVLVWGSNLFQTNEEGIIGSQLRRALDRGARLITIDPRKTLLAAKAHLWLQPRPGTDLALALGMLKVILDEELHDREFVEKWTVGFEELREHLRKYPLKHVSEITWIPEGEIAQAARLYACTKPAGIQWGNALEHNINSVQCVRALMILKAITGNLDHPGGNVNRVSPAVMRPGEFVLGKSFGDKGEKLLSPEFRLAAQMGFTPSQLIVKTILSGKPHPIQVMYIQGGNPLLSYANAKETFQALKKLDFLAVAEIFMTPTAQLADLVLPAATNFEFDDIGHYGLPHGFILARPKVVDPPEECWPDSLILNELGKKLGHEKLFWPNLRACLDDVLKPARLTFEDFKNVGILKGDWAYKSYEKKGFKTPSGKVEIYSSRFKDWAYDPLPVYRGLPELPKGDTESNPRYPLTLTSAKDAHFFHSAYRNIPSLRKLSPDPVVLLNPETAEKLNIQEGDWAFIETPRGTIRQKVALAAELHPDVVIAAYGWWFPERTDLELSGWKESNINILTDNNPPYEPAIGSTNLRAVPCRVYKE
ncbi:MAG: molybdopterin-dependent oxidoreductase [Thermodesulfobacteriota bacterium]|nr:molybdopterin-dependent oxidoreductase [Thermodesulfobacteriota bacterium]